MKRCRVKQIMPLMRSMSEDWRIEEHPIVRFDRGRRVTIYLDDRPLTAYTNETVAAALYANGVRIFSRSLRYHRPRGFFCAIGKCSSCMMEVDGVPNVRVCMIRVRDGMKLRRLKGYPSVEHDIYSIIDKISSFLPTGFYYKWFLRPAFLRNFFMNRITKMSGIGRLPKGPIQKAPMKKESRIVDVAVIGGGPAGLSAAIEAGILCKSVLIAEDQFRLGGQLVKQTHRFFGDAEHYAGIRGIKIAEDLVKKIQSLKSVEALTECRAFGIYENNVVGVAGNSRFVEVKAKKIVIATGAYERTLVFEDNDLPGVYGAGGIQTLMNTYAVKPGRSALIVGSGNVGLILTYQLLQSGVDVKAIVEALPRIGGYWVHAAKVRRYGVPIYTFHTVLKVLGRKKVEGAIIVKLNEKWSPIKGSERRIDCDMIAVNVGLNPSCELVQQAGAKLKFIPDLGGFVAVRNRFMQVNGDVYVAGDVSGIEEATSAMLEGQIAGLHASLSLGYGGSGEEEKIKNLIRELEEERSGPFGSRIRKGLEEALVEAV